MKSDSMKIPCVRWGSWNISRLLIGHNLVKGQSHFSEALDREMKNWHAPELDHGVETLERCEECGINTAQFGAPIMHSLLTKHKQRGGNIQWIATLYGNEDGVLGYGDRMGMKEELSQILDVVPRPIGVQHYGEKTDRLFFAGKLDLVRERTKLLRDTGLLVGVGTHLPQVAEEIASQNWDIDFLQPCFYTVYSQTGEMAIDRENEVFQDQDRDRMVRLIRQVDEPCLAFKVLAANRKCDSDESVRSALEFAFRNIKETDVVLVGMWQKQKDQVGQNAVWTCEILDKMHKENANP